RGDDPARHPLHGGSRAAVRPGRSHRRRAGRRARPPGRPGRARQWRQDGALPALGAVRRPPADGSSRGEPGRPAGTARARDRNRRARQRGDPHPRGGRGDRPRRPARLLEPRGRVRPADRKAARSHQRRSLVMNSLTMPATQSSALPARARRAAFGQVVLNEARLTWRRPIGLIGGVAIPLLLLIIFGLLPAFKQAPATFGGETIFDVYVPVLAAFGLAM